MKRKLIALAALGIALSAPGAFATEAAVVSADCGFNTVAEETATGGQDTYTGAAYGYVVSDAAEAVTVRCEVRVDGGAVATTPTGSGTGVATSQGQVTYTASDTQDVDLCAVYTVNGGSSTSVCGETTTTQIPPQEVIDLVMDLVVTVNDLVGCVSVVNFGWCDSGICLVNTSTGWCDGGVCVVNSGHCGYGCISVANARSCGRT